MAVGGSTNAVLHFLAIAHAANVEWTIDDFERVRRKVGVLCDLTPSDKYVAKLNHTKWHAQHRGFAVLTKVVTALSRQRTAKPNALSISAFTSSQ